MKILFLCKALSIQNSSRLQPSWSHDYGTHNVYFYILFTPYVGGPSFHIPFYKSVCSCVIKHYRSIQSLKSTGGWTTRQNDGLLNAVTHE